MSAPAIPRPRAGLGVRAITDPAPGPYRMVNLDWACAIDDDQGAEVCRIYMRDYYRRDQYRATARLLRAAPELRDALAALLDATGEAAAREARDTARRLLAGIEQPMTIDRSNQP